MDHGEKLKQKGTTDIQGRFEQFMSMNDDTEGVFVLQVMAKCFRDILTKKMPADYVATGRIGIKTAGRKTESCLFPAPYPAFYRYACGHHL
ncbi:hypothetical protein ACEQPO_23420 [Bacillus sp. SL00103]